MKDNSTQPGLLLVEDTPSLQMLYSTVLRKAGYVTQTASTGQEALAKFTELRPAVVLLDLILPDGDGMLIMREMLALEPRTRVIVITANGSVNVAVEATRAGAHDFLVKPLGDIRLIGAVANAMAETRTLGPDTASAAAPMIDPTLLGQSDAMRQLYARIEAVARSMAPVFVLGESGTGKEFCARAIHLKSARAQGRFVCVNFSALPTDAQESELFGQPARSGMGSQMRAGALLRADGGTLFLENIQDMTPQVQARLLSFLQTGTISVPGGGETLRADLRLICAGKRDPVEDMRTGRLREDLYYRLFVIPLQVPPLRARGDDVAILARHFLTQIAGEEGKTFTGLSPDVLALFRRAPWPGNLRELVNVLRLAVVLHDGPIITPDMLPREFDASHPPARDTSPTRHANPAEAFSGMTMARIEEMIITATIRRHGGSVPRAARELDIAPSTIYRKRESWTSEGDQQS